MCHRHLLSPSACSTEGFFAEKRLSYPAQQGERKGFVKGESVPLDRVLLTFARTKVSPRRAGVLIKPFIRLAPPEVTTIFFTNAPPAGVQIRTLYKSLSADRRYPAIT